MDWKTRYAKICEKLGIDPQFDEDATKVLDAMVREPDLRELAQDIENKDVLIFGCGPSLEEDVRRIKKGQLHERSTLIAADGAVEALLKVDIVPLVNVTDLDGNIKSIIEANKLGAITVVHAHGDNVPLLVDTLPRLKGAVIGTTQTAPTEKIKNFGGFTDGDRAVFMAVHFRARKILLAGMDFGAKIGEYSGSYEKEKKLVKLKIGKELIEELASETDIPILNITSGGEELENIARISVESI